MTATEPNPGHMSAEEFRRAGYALVDWVAGYRARLERDEIPVRSAVEPGAVRERLPAHPPEESEPWEHWLADLDEIVVPGLTHWQHPGFFAWFPGSSGEPAILGELAAAGLAVQGMVWDSSPACTELETLVLDWLTEMLGLPDRFRSDGPTGGGGVIQDTASTATLAAIVAARYRTEGEPTVYASSQAHSSIAKGARIAGIEHVRLVAVDDSYAMNCADLEAAIAADRSHGLAPSLIVSTVGSTGSGAIDPVAAVSDVARREQIWHHVDAAMYGTAAVCPEHRHMLDGVEHADSFVFNPHKWMLVNVDCSAMFVANRAPLIDALGIQAAYLRNPASESGDVIDYRDWHVQLGRRFRALKLWFTIRHYGVEGLRAHVRRHCAWAADLARRLEADPRFEVVAPVPLSLVCFAHLDGDAATQRVADDLNASGDVFVTTTRLDERLVVRVAIGGRHTRASDVDRLWSLLARTA